MDYYKMRYVEGKPLMGYVLDMKRDHSKLQYSHERYKRLSKGIHTWTMTDWLAFQLIKSGHQDFISWTK